MYNWFKFSSLNNKCYCNYFSIHLFSFKLEEGMLREALLFHSGGLMKVRMLRWKLFISVNSAHVNSCSLYRYILLLHGPLFLFIITVCWLITVMMLHCICLFDVVGISVPVRKTVEVRLNSKFHLQVCIFRVSIGWLMTYVVSGALVLGNNFWSVFSYLFYLTTLSGRMTEKLP